MAKKSLADEMADAVLEWVESVSSDVAEALLGSAMAPMVVQPPFKEGLAYFRRYLWLPDGSVNVAGRDFLQHGGPIDPVTGKPSKFGGYGPQEFEQIVLADVGEPGPLPSVPTEVY